MKVVLCLFALVLIGLFSGCASLSKDECLQGDWHYLGVKDGTKGRAISRFEKYQDACSEYGVIPSRELYAKGRDEGLKTYCTPQNGYDEGIRGNRYYHVCPKSLEPAFLRRYDLGKQIYSLQWELDRTDSNITRLENRLDEEVDSSRRRSIRWEIRDLRRKRDRLQRKLMVLEINSHNS